MKAMIFAAGYGTRLKPITDFIPKALVSLHGKPLLEHTILKLKSAGVNEIIVNVHHFGEQIIDFLREKDNFGIRIEVSDERDELLDTGGGLKKAAYFFDDNKPFLVHNVDILSNVDINEIYSQHQADSNRLATLVVSYRDTHRYLLFDEIGKLHGWVNLKTSETKPAPDLDISLYNRFAYAGIQVVSPDIFQLMENYGSKFPIMDFYLQHCQLEKIIGYAPDNLQMLDVGKVGALEKAEEFAAEFTANSTL